MKVLLTEGSGLTSRQTAIRLRGLGHTVGVLSSDPIALTRFTRTVSAWHRVPGFGADPFAWLDAAIDVVRRHRYDLLFPTQEQVTVLSWAAGTTKLEDIATIVPPFESLRAVQDKIAARATLERLGIPQPPSTVLRDLDELGRWDEFPVFVKTPIGTATSGVRRVDDRAGLAALVRDWATADVLDGNGEGVLVQASADGPLAMLQSVLDRGRLVAFHANLRTGQGARGGASHKRSIVLPGARAAVETLGRELAWHGALSADVILTVDGPVVIDVNPRLVEPGNAWRSGVDLVGAMIDIACDREPAEQPPGRPDLDTHQLLLAILGAAEHHRGRSGIIDELLGAARHSGGYAGSTEELTPILHDWRAALPIVVAAAATLVDPSTWSWFSSGSVANYAISPEGWRTICSRARPPIVERERRSRAPASGVRVPPAPRRSLGLRARVVAAVAGRATGGDPPRVFTTLARHPRLFRSWLPFSTTLLLRGDLPGADRELVILRTAWQCACHYEWAQHVPLALRAGLAPATVERVPDGLEAPGWTARQQLLLRAADELHTRRVIGDDTWQGLASEFSERQLIELSFLVGHYEMLAMVLNSLGVEPEPTALAKLTGPAARGAEELRAALGAATRDG